MNDILPLKNNITARSYSNTNLNNLLKIEPEERNIKINNDISENNNFEKSFSILTNKIKKEQKEEKNKFILSRSQSTRNLDNLKSPFKSVSFITNFYEKSINNNQMYDFTSNSFMIPKRYFFFN